MKLATGGYAIAAVEHDLVFHDYVAVAAGEDGQPDCQVTPAIRKDMTTFAFRPAGCDPTAGTCTHLRVNVFSLVNPEPISDQAVLYTCRVRVRAYGAPLGVARVTLRDRDERAIAQSNGRGGNVCLRLQPSPPPVCASPRPAPHAPAVYVEDLSVATLPAEIAQAAVKLASGDFAVAEIVHDLEFSEGVTVGARSDGTPNCRPGAGLNKEFVLFAFRPTGCSPLAGNCTRVRVVIFSLENLDPISDGSLLYICNVRVSGNGGQLLVTNVELTDPNSDLIPQATGRAGTICVDQPLLPGCTGLQPLPSEPTAVLQDVVLPQPGAGTLIGWLADGRSEIQSASFDIQLDSGVCVRATTNGRPDCSVNPELLKDGSLFTFLPAGCTPASGTCTAVHVDIRPEAENFLYRLPHGAKLFTCNLEAGRSAALRVGNLSLLTRAGTGVPGVYGSRASVCIGGNVPPACPLPRPAPFGPSVYVEELRLDQPGDATITVRLSTGGQQISGVQNDILFNDKVRVKARPDGQPDCTVNPALLRDGSHFAFQPFGCNGSACSGIRAVVFSLQNVQPIPDDAILYRCVASVSAPTVVFATNARASTPAGQPVESLSAREGVVCVGSGPSPLECPAPRAAPSGPAVYVDDTAVASWGDGTIRVKLSTGGQEIAAVQVDLVFAPEIRVRERANGRPDCRVNPSIDKPSTAFAFQPSGCSGAACTGVRALVYAVNNNSAIPDQSTLFTCNITILQSGRLEVRNARGSNRQGGPVEGMNGRDGFCVNPPLALPSTRLR
ncbi:MAG: hypothetical protein N3C12_07155 [Candidatus Binatia bacterium]|nr:hypothetical protein [Candidatus Binatia bacterium]